jgi:hypothetical protein
MHGAEPPALLCRAHYCRSECGARTEECARAVRAREAADPSRGDHRCRALHRRIARVQVHTGEERVRGLVRGRRNLRSTRRRTQRRPRLMRALNERGRGRHRLLTVKFHTRTYNIHIYLFLSLNAHDCVSRSDDLARRCLLPRAHSSSVLLASHIRRYRAHLRVLLGDC